MVAGLASGSVLPRAASRGPAVRRGVLRAVDDSVAVAPRAWYLQAVATGISVAIGYGVGCLIAWVVRRCGVSPDWSEQWPRRGWWALAVAAAVVIPLFLILGSWWQQIVRKLVGVEDPGRPLYIAVLVVSLVVAVAVLALGRLLRRASQALTRWGKQYVPKPVARIASVIVVALLVVFAVNGALVRGIVAVAERSASTADRGNRRGRREAHRGRTVGFGCLERGVGFPGAGGATLRRVRGIAGRDQ
ncbi:MAG: alpha/beta-hydrolase N-terminal domain-containing protein [Rhodococcus sp. (in: high G+C Gram-positive bacteria)]|nr:alpha/beta-hydrolase N-terminal domain-containing protein [Rhodococcus sp. (in: high G+C Gram-positive bacteria)]